MRVPLLSLFLFGLFAVVVQADVDPNTVFTEKAISYKYIFVFVSLLVVVVIRYLINAWDIVVPYVLFAIVLGLLWGIGCVYYDWMSEVSVISELMILYVPDYYLPVILYTTAFCLDTHTFMKCFSQILVISIPAASVAAAATGLLMRQVLNSNWDAYLAILFGVMFLPIYPMHLERFLKETSVHTKYVTILLQGETLVTSVVGFAIYWVILLYITGWITEWYQFVMGPIRMLLAFPVGYLVGKLSVTLMKVAHNDVTDLMLLTFVSCFLSHYLGYYVARAGMLSCIITGGLMGRERPSLTREVEESLLNLWHLFTILMNGVVFVAIGVIIPKFTKFDEMRYSDFFIICVTYLMTNIWRFFAMFLFSPLLSRMGYGMSFKAMVVIAWGGLKSPFVVYFVVWFIVNTEHNDVTQTFFIHTVGVYILMLLINASFVPVLFRTLGLSDISMSKQMNMSNCMKYVHDTKDRIVAILKMDRLLSDANWPLVMSSTTLKHPYKKLYQASEDDDEEEDEEFLMRYRFTYCPDCQKQIPNEPSQKEMREMTREAKLRLLKHKKTVYSRQYENGMMSKEGSRILHQAVELAMDTEDLMIELDGLFQMFSNESRLYKFIHKHFQGLIATRAEKLNAPTKEFKLLCYCIVHHVAFSIFMYSVVLCHMIVITVNFEINHGYGVDAEDIVANVMRFLFFLAYAVEFYLKVMAYSWLSVKNGLKTYFKMPKHLVDFSILCVTGWYAIANSIYMAVHQSVYTHWYLGIVCNLLLFARVSQLLAYFGLCDVCKRMGHAILDFLCQETEKNKSLAYELAKSYITGEDEILENLPQLVDNDKIQEKLRERTEQDKLAVTMRLGLLQVAAPWVTTTVKTRMAIRAVLNSLRNEIFELKVAGWVDDVECNKLLGALAECYDEIGLITSVPPSAPKLIFREVLYLCGDDDILDYLFRNICTRKFDPGDVVYKEGEQVEGIYILITGMFRISYTPRKPILDKIRDSGCMPCVDYLCPNWYDKDFAEYITPGNTIGELATMTNRPYDGTIVAETHSEVFLMKTDAIKTAMGMDPDPVDGFECRLWKCIGFRKAVTVLTTVPAYRSLTQEKILYILERAFMPNLSNYKVFVVSDMMQDIILIEGVAVDLNTRDVYTAPCHIPRAVQKLVLSSSSLMNIESPVQTQLMIIPAKNVDEYEMMVKEESICELVDANSTKCLRHIIQERKNKNSPYFKISKLHNISSRFRKAMLGEGSKGTKGSKITFASSKTSKMSAKSSAASQFA